MDTSVYLTGNCELAERFGAKPEAFRSGTAYRLPSPHGDNWLVDIYPAPGLILTDTHFSLPEPVVWEYTIAEAGLWLCSFNGGDMTIVEKGKKARQLRPGIHLLVNRGQPFKMIYGAGKWQCYTGMWLFGDYIATQLTGRMSDRSFTLDEALTWQSPQYDTPELLLVFEQLKANVRNAAAPLPYYEHKACEVLLLILRNIQDEHWWKRYQKSQRKNYLSYHDRKYIIKIKEELDRDILSPPPVDQLAIMVQMNISKLQHCFKLWYGVSIAEYIRAGKMKYALRLLWDDGLSIKNIAAMAGYENASKFAAAFKKVHGFSPQYIRKSFGL
ncbi:helix-turn-helix domain-containing protein [Sporomusa termitida]|uniref:HTH-type transcriptional activator RhaR n=1 Tax=Sporomusa termitida TaxID=2377 RepID=A0A517DQ79_9FIRM|nr:AraC family transcriptional regulator [Sporomusa termitida]QDR79511.1 HTH-type transcriptional activator RhaR [Sporomusa termitida]